MLRFWRRNAPADAPVSGAAVILSSAVPRWRVFACALLMIANPAVSGLLLLQHYRVGAAVAAVGQVCGEGAQSGCETVAQSPYAEVRRVPLAAIGLAVSASLGGLLPVAAGAGGGGRPAAGPVP